MLNFCIYNRRNALDLNKAYVEGFTEHLLHVLNDPVLEEKAEKASRDCFDALMQMPYDGGSTDISSFAEDARDHGIEVYTDLRFVRDQLYQMAMAGLYHLWERTFKKWLQREFGFNGLRCGKPIAHWNFKDITNFLEQNCDYGFSNQTYFNDLDSLRLIANVSKHGDGQSAEKLIKKAPRLFQLFPMDDKDPLPFITPTADDLTVKPEDFLKAAGAVEQFWKSFPEHLTVSV